MALALNGFLDNISKFFFAPEETKAALREEFCKKTLPLKFSQLEVRLIDTFSSLSLEIFNFIIYIKMIQFVSQARLCQNGGGYFAGENLTYADLMLVVVNDNLRLMKMTMMIMMMMIKQCHQIKHNNLSFQVREGWGGKRD